MISTRFSDKSKRYKTIKYIFLSSNWTNKYEIFIFNTVDTLQKIKELIGIISQ